MGFLSRVILLCFVLLSQTISRWAHLDSVHVQQNIKSSHSKDSPLIIHTLRLFFLKKTMLYSFHTFTVSLSCPESEINENFLAVNWGTGILESWYFWSLVLWNHIFLVSEIGINFSVWKCKGPLTTTFATSLP